MPKKIEALSPLAVKRLIHGGLHAVGGISGLCLRIISLKSRSWVLRLRINGKRREFGLGGYPDISLADARLKAQKIKLDLSNGIDVVKERQDRRQAAKFAAATFMQCSKQLIEDKAAEWRNDKHKQQWERTLEAYAYPVIGKRPMNTIEVAHVLEVLEPIWNEKTETASRVRGRMEAVFDWAIVRKLRDSDNPARWKGYLDKILPSPKKISKPVHHRAVPFAEIYVFLQQLRKAEGIARRALEFVILTAARSGEVRGATWSEINLKEKLWTIPAERMKAAKEHRVPLSDDAITLLNALPRFEGVEFIFPSPRGGKLSDMALTKTMRDMKIDAVPHGFRSTFRDWVAECTNFPNEVAEMALAHIIKNKVEAAYRRGDLIEKRRQMMTDWALYCNTKPKKG